VTDNKRNAVCPYEHLTEKAGFCKNCGESWPGNPKPVEWDWSVDVHNHQAMRHGDGTLLRMCGTCGEDLVHEVHLRSGETSAQARKRLAKFATQQQPDASIWLKHYPTRRKGEPGNLVLEYGVCACGAAVADGVTEYVYIWQKHMEEITRSSQPDASKLAIDMKFVEKVEQEVGMGHGAWDTINPVEICKAVTRILSGGQ
jgi:hypothetical protein